MTVNDRTPRSFALVLLLCVAAVFGAPSIGHAAITVYFANLSGPNESPVNNSAGVGFAEIDFNDTAHTMRVMVTFSGLTGTTTASHIHAATTAPLTSTAGVATQTPTFANFPLGVKSGSYDNTFDMSLNSSYNPAYIPTVGGTAASAEAALAAAAASGSAYLNIHTSAFSGGEIRGFLVPGAAVPEPSSLALAGILIAGLAGYGRRRRKPTMA